MTVTDKKLRRIKSQRKTTGEILKNAVARILKLEGQVQYFKSGSGLQLQRVRQNDSRLKGGVYTINAPEAIGYRYCYAVLRSSPATMLVDGTCDTAKAVAIDIETRADNGDVTIKGVTQGDCIISFWGSGDAGPELQPMT